MVVRQCPIRKYGPVMVRLALGSDDVKVVLSEEAFIYAFIIFFLGNKERIELHAME